MASPTPSVLSTLPPPPPSPLLAVATDRDFSGTEPKEIVTVNNAGIIAVNADINTNIDVGGDSTTTKPRLENLGRVLITGSSGFIGRNLVNWLASRALAKRIVMVDIVPPAEGAHAEFGGVHSWDYWNVVADGGDDASDTLRERIRNSAKAIPELIVYVRSSQGYADKSLMMFAMDAFDVERVIHLGGETSVDRSFADPVACMNTNVSHSAAFVDVCAMYSNTTVKALDCAEASAFGLRTSGAYPFATGNVERARATFQNQDQGQDHSRTQTQTIAVARQSFVAAGERNSITYSVGVTDNNADRVDIDTKYTINVPFTNRNSAVNAASEAELARMADSRSSAAAYAPSESAREKSMLLAAALHTTNTARVDPAHRRLKRFVQMSTDEVFGDANEIPNREDAPYMPTNPYAASKAASELVAMATSRSQSLPVSVLRSTNIFGPWQTWDKAIPAFVRGAIKQNTIAIHGSGTQMRTWIHVDDVCSALALVATAPECGVFNIAGETELTVVELALRLCESLGRSDVHMVHVKDRPHNDRFYRVDASHIRATLGWKPEPISFTDRIAHVAKHYASRLQETHAVP